MIQSIEKLGWRASIPLLTVVCLLLVAEPGPTARASLLPSLPREQPDEPLPFEKTMERELSHGEKRRYSFTLEAGRFVQAVVEQDGVDALVTIFGQDGKLLAEVDRPNSMQGLETISLIAPGSGVYHLQIRAQRTASIPGRYRITLKEPRAAISSDEKQIAAEKLVTEAVRLWMKNTADALRQSAGKYERAQSLWNELREPYEEALALYGAGLSYRSLGENQAAITVFKRALELMRNAGNRLGIAIVQAGVGWSYLRLGELDQALESFRQSLELREGRSNPAGEGLAYYGIGWVYLWRNEDQLALENFGRSLGLRQAANDQRGEAFTRIGLGKIYSRQERYDESRAMLEQALRALHDLDDKGGQADALSHLGWIGIRLKQDAVAKAHFQAEFDLSQASGDRTAE
ncbi:MAG: tetratricopeptide repeat protein, partial [Blastocatellia bacterium]